MMSWVQTTGMKLQENIFLIKRDKENDNLIVTWKSFALVEQQQTSLVTTVPAENTRLDENKNTL